MKTKFTLLSTTLLTVLLAAGCGGQKSQEGTPAPEAPASEQAAPASGSAASTQSANANAEAREVVIKANDQMKFDIENFDVKPGETIRLVLDNVGTMPKFSMGHNVVILKLDADPAAFVEAAMNAAGNEYIPQGSEDKIVAHTKLLGGGEKDTITFTAPEQTGAYPFLCSFPGHYQIGMKGTMTVK